jgi:putative addiction module component (TIGR02574 family)
MTALAQSISTLPVEERLQLVWDIWDSIAEDQSNIPVSEEDKAEIRRRLELYRKGELTSDTWENVRAKILANRP